MRVLLSMFMAVVIIASCKNENGNFTVSGKIKNAPSDQIFLQELSYNSADVKTIDSAKIDKDGNYILKGTSPQQNLFVISFKDNPAAIVVNDKQDIKMDFDLNGFHFPEINGSDATKELYSFIKDYWQKDSMLSLTYTELDTLSSEKAQDSAYVTSLKFQYGKEMNDLSDLIRNFISQSKNPAAICFVLDKAKGFIAPDELSSLAQDASKRFPQHTGITTFKTSLAQQAQAASSNSAYDLLNQQAPDLTMRSIDGKKISISDYKGKYVLVDFWASWCNPCRQENPNVVAVFNRFKNKNFSILGVSLDDDKSAWQKAVKDDNLNWAQMSDLQSPSAAVYAYRFDGIPFNVLIDPQGKIIASGLRGPALEQKLNEVLQ